MSDIQRNRNNSKLIEMVNSLQLEFPVAEIAERLKVDKGNLSSFLNNKKSVSSKFLEKFAEAYNLKLEDFTDEVSGQGETYKKDQTKIVGVPFYDLEFTASFFEVENNQSTVPSSYISHPFFKGCDYVVRASGQSMAKVICHGDAIGLVQVNNWRDFFPFGEIYAIVTNDGFRMIKVVTAGETKEFYTLISKPTDSKKDEFPPQQIKKDTILHLFKVQASSHLF